MERKVLEAALIGFDYQIANLTDQKASVLRQLEGLTNPKALTAHHPKRQSKAIRKKRVLSPEARQSIVDAQHKRWAKVRGEQA